jgi:hypothetical protein
MLRVNDYPSGSSRLGVSFKLAGGGLTNGCRCLAWGVDSLMGVTRNSVFGAMFDCLWVLSSVIC